MMSFPIDVIPQLSEEDVLPIDHVQEYEQRKRWRDLADERLAQVGDGMDDIVQRGRPTGP
ncbi:MAG: hypothetical protein ACR2KS_06030 [Candidatus Eremiobacter antarcticus]|nr:hypothetical protein [Candidatus Eremiobacteraeota bacterium]MBC5807849.1 hypothetical protein [Candidatus Eremiobacteraeota bacterium]